MTVFISKKHSLWRKALTLSLLLFTVAVYAQDKEIKELTKFIKKKRVNAAYGMLGTNFFEFSKLNVNLEQKGIPHVPRGYLSYGVGGHFIQDKLVLGFELVQLKERYTNHAKSAEFLASVSGKFINLLVGHLVFSRKGLMVYPYTSLGMGRLKMVVVENSIDSFNKIDTLHMSNMVEKLDFVMGLGIAGDYFFNYSKKSKGNNSIMIGFRMGVNMSPVPGNWRLNRIKVYDGPQMGINGPYFRIIVGLGGWAERLIRQAMR